MTVVSKCCITIKQKLMLLGYNNNQIKYINHLLLFFKSGLSVYNIKYAQISTYIRSYIDYINTPYPMPSITKSYAWKQ